MRSGALSHVRVLDLSRVLAGPWASQLLADLGAEVVKIERPGAGDESRGWGPPWLATPDGAETRESAYFACANRGKKSVTVDLASPEGQAIVRRLAARSDVLLENFKVGSLSRLGLGWEDLSALNPRLVYCSITGFGQSGPYKDRPGYDFVVQAMGGLMSVTGEPDGEPMKAGVAMTDILTGMYAATAVLAALAHRERSGQGQYVDLALLDVQVATLANLAESYLVTGRAPARLGNAHASIVPYQAFATRDGRLVVAVGNDGQFARLCKVVGRPELGGRPALRHQRRARREPRGARPHPPGAPRRPAHAGLGLRARGGGRALRPHQRPRAGVRGSARPGPRPPRRGAASARREGAGGGLAHAPLPDAGAPRHAAAPRRAHGRGAGGRPGHGGGGD